MEKDIKTEETSQQDQTPKYRNLVVGFNDLTLGISMVVAVAIGAGMGYGLEQIFGYAWLFWVGICFGIGAAINNMFKAYQRQMKEFEKLQQEPRYRYKKDLEEQKKKNEEK
ncbi:hypothetical protein CCZ01_03680 [Helicobacter monodelphidis]|uniref:AtpZ/AtpI family protein n=1 Tax=Helicobacter sp. 15-1451 TaxID=2004995 RepID=UPI000DCB7D6F|nr:AtpZ/AtpI family protein [Helicobacter sp. 15-1451]RAX58185.1 hypothetical protein CCZ01_03680 [Helicobacter sp. 15-1451]